MEACVSRTAVVQGPLSSLDFTDWRHPQQPQGSQSGDLLWLLSPTAVGPAPQNLVNSGTIAKANERQGCMNL